MLRPTRIGADCDGHTTGPVAGRTAGPRVRTVTNRPALNDSNHAYRRVRVRVSFAEVWAVDREPDFAQMVQAKTGKLGAGNIRPVTADAETLDAEPGHFELAVIGSAFHRLDRDLVAARLPYWLRPGGWAALCWADVPQLGDREWQRALAALLDRWQTVLGATGRAPANWAEPQRRRPDAQVLSEAGFETARRHEFPVEHRWSLAELAGYVRSTSFLPPRSSATTSRPPSARSPPPTAPSRTTWASSTTWPASRQTRQSRVLRTCPKVGVSTQLVSAGGFDAIVVSWARPGYRDRASCCWRCASRLALTWPRSCLRMVASLPARSWPRAGTVRSACSRSARTPSATPPAGCANC